MTAGCQKNGGGEQCWQQQGLVLRHGGFRFSLFVMMRSMERRIIGSHWRMEIDVYRW